MNTTHNNYRDESILGKLSARTRATIEALTRSPLASQALEAVENESLAHRRQLLADSKTLRQAFPASLAAALRPVDLAVAKVDAATAALEVAKQDFRRIQIAANNVAIGHDNAVNAIESELRNTADVRLADFKHHLNYALVNDLRFALITWVNISASRRGATVVENNMPAVVAAQEACRKALAEIDALQLEPLTYADVSQWLMRTCADLAVPFAVLECNPPSLTNEHAEVGRPFKWAGKSAWIADAGIRETSDMRQARAEAFALTLAKAI